MLVRIFLAAIILLSCNAEKRCQRHYQKAIKCGQSDTVVKHDTIKGFKIVREFQSDTLTNIDTFYIDSGGVRVQTVVKWKEKKIIQTVNKTDTIIKRLVVNNYTFKDKEVYPWWLRWLIGSLLSIIIGLIFWPRK